MKKTNLLKTSLLFCLAILSASILSAATITVNPGDNLKTKITGAGNGDIVQINAGTYDVGGEMTTTANITVVGIPFENSNNDESKIDDVVVNFTDPSADNWTTNGRVTIRGIKFKNGDHQIQLNNEGIVSYCIFQNGVDQLSFDKGGYGEISYCQFYNSGDDGIDCDYEEDTPGAYIRVHHNYFEESSEDGVEFRTHPRPSGAEMMENVYHDNVFYRCGTGDGDAIQIIDQDGSENSRYIVVYNNVIDGAGVTFNGIMCNDNRNSNAQSNPVGATSMRESIWIYNNTVIDVKYGGIGGSNNTWAFNNIVKDLDKGLIHCTVKCNLTHNVNTNTSNVTDEGSNHYNTNPEMDLNTYELLTGSYSIDKGLLSYTGGGRTITPDYYNAAPDLGAKEQTGPPPPMVMLTVSTAGIGTGEVSPSSGLVVEGSDVTLTATPDLGSKFMYWSGDASGTDASITITMDVDKSVVANFDLIGPTTEVILNPTDDSFVLDNDVNVNKGSDPVISVKDFTRKAGLVKFDLSGITEPIAYATLQLTGTNAANGGNLSAYTTTDGWNESTVTYSNGPTPGDFVGATPLGAAGSVYEIDASNYVISENIADQTVSFWLNDDQLNVTRYDFASKEAAGDIGPKLILQVEGSPVGTHFLTIIAENGTVTPGSGSYDENTTVTLTATPDPGYEFTEWTGDVSGTNPVINVYMDADKTVTAVFTPLPLYDLTTDVVGSGSTDPFSRTYIEGAEATITATPDEGWLFDSWSGDASGTMNPVTIIMDSDKHVVANFIEDTSSSEITDILDPTDDAYVKSTVPNTNFGSSAYLKVNAANKEAFMKFDLSTIGTVSSAELQVTSNGPGTVQLWKVTDDAWDEMSITWNTKLENKVLLGTYEFTLAGTQSLNVTYYINAHAEKDDAASFGLVEVNSTNVILDSKEGINGPKLTVVHDGVPKEATLSITSNVQMYPNPTSGTINLEINDVDFEYGIVQVYNVNGILLETITVDNPNSIIELDGNSGLYFIKTIYNDVVKTISILKE